jgi:uncharacterized membrane protein
LSERLIRLEETPLSKNTQASGTCAICGKSFPKRELIAGAVIRNAVADWILKDHPEWSPEAFICRSDLALYRSAYVISILEAEKGEFSSLEENVLTSLREHELLATNVEAEFERDRSLGERLADRVASFGGSWTFLILFGFFLAIWIAMNSIVLWWRPTDPYPFIFLNLILSCLAAIQAPVIMMSQNRQEAKDRLRSQHDYQVNLKAELEIRQLHEKIDHLSTRQWERLAEIQQIQLELLSELGGR